MGAHTLALLNDRSSRFVRALVAAFLVAGVLAAVTIVNTRGAYSATMGTTAPYYFGPAVVDGGVDVNGDGVVDSDDDAIDFFRDTLLDDGYLDCDQWGTADAANLDTTEKEKFNDATGNGTGGDGIDGDDDCTLRGFTGNGATGGNVVFIHVVNGHFKYTSSSYNGTKTLIPDGYRLPGKYESTSTSFSRSSAEWYWLAVAGKLDVGDAWDSADRDGSANGDDDLAEIWAPEDDSFEYAVNGSDTVDSDGLDIEDGFIDANDDGDVSDSTARADDDCDSCIFGYAVVNGLIQTTGLSYTSGGGGSTSTVTASPAVTRSRAAASETSARTSANKAVTAECTGSKLPYGGGFTLVGADATLAHLTVVANGPTATGWRVRVLEMTPTSGTWAIKATAICA